MDYKKYKKLEIIEEIDEVYTLVKCKDFLFKIRKEKIDAFTVDEVIFRSGYLKDLELNKTDICLDIGANIGVFSVIASGLCQRIIAFEPDLENYELAKENLKLNNIDNVKLLNLAVMPKTQSVELYLNNGVCSDCHSTLPIRGREKVTVAGVGINEAINTYEATKLKIDCEGEELNFMQVADLKTVERLTMEVHFTYSKRDNHRRYYKMLANIVNQFDHVKFPKVNNNFSKMLKAEKFKK